MDGATIDDLYNNVDQLILAGSITDDSQITTYNHDTADRLTNITWPDTTAIAYGYDADGRPIKQTVGSAITNYVWDEALPYSDVVLETN